MSRYVLTPEAQQDLKHIRDYLVREASPRVARRVVSALVVAFRSIASSPGQGHRREELTSRHELRFWSVFSYLIVYRTYETPCR